MVLSMPITRFSARAAIRLRGSEVVMAARIAPGTWVMLAP
jgi:hypothetical protein